MSAYARACAWAARVWPAGERRRRTLEGRLREIERALAGKPSVRDRGRLMRRREALARSLDPPKFATAVEFTALPVTYDAAFALATVLAVVGVVAAAAATALVLLLQPPSLPLVAPAAWTLPLLLFAAVLGYPESLARRLRVRSLGRAPEAVNFLALSLRLRPSLSEAVRFAAEGAEEPMAGMLRRVVWSVHLRRHAAIEQAFQEFAESWRGWNDDLRRALHDLASAAREGSGAAVERFCDRARELVREGTKEKIRAYAGSLRAPAAALFALGVLLPLILGTVLPMTALGPAMAVGADRGTPEPPAVSPWLIVLLLDVAFPAGTFLLAHHILSRRPGMGSVAESGWPKVRPRALPAMASGALLLPLVAAPSPIGDIAPVLAVAASVSALLLVATRDAARRARELRALDEEFPDALFRLGALVGGGLPPETAIGKVAEELGDTPTGRLFNAIAHAMRLRRQSLREVLFGEAGLLRDHPSRLVRSSMRLVVDVTSRDPASASRGMLETAAYLRDLKRLETEMRESLRSTMESLRATATFFAPLVLGITCAMYALLGTVFARFASLPLPPSLFNAACAVYLALSCAASTYFAVGVERGPDPVAYLAAVGRGLPVAMAVFAGSLLLGSLLLG